MIKTDKIQSVPLEKDEYIPYCKASKIADDTFEYFKKVINAFVDLYLL